MAVVAIMKRCRDRPLAIVFNSFCKFEFLPVDCRLVNSDFFLLIMLSHM